MKNYEKTVYLDIISICLSVIVILFSTSYKLTASENKFILTNQSSVENSNEISKNYLTEISAAQFVVLASERSLMCDDLMYNVLRDKQYNLIQENIDRITSLITLCGNIKPGAIKEELWQEFLNEYAEFKDNNRTVVEMSREKDNYIAAGELGNSIIEDINIVIMQASLKSESSAFNCAEILHQLAGID